MFTLFSQFPVLFSKKILYQFSIEFQDQINLYFFIRELNKQALVLRQFFGFEGIYAFKILTVYTNIFKIYFVYYTNPFINENFRDFLKDNLIDISDSVFNIIYSLQILKKRKLWRILIAHVLNRWHLKRGI